MKTMINSKLAVRVASSGSDRLAPVQTDPTIRHAPWRPQGVREIFMSTTRNAIRMPFLTRFRAAFAFGIATIVLAFAWTGVANAQLQGAAGNVRVNIEWNGNVDLDLYVRDPCGNVFGYGESSPRQIKDCRGFGGAWDLDDEGFDFGNDDPNSENIAWPNGAPAGLYQVHVNYFSGSIETNYTVTVFNGNERTTHTGSIGPAQEGSRQFVTEFVADESVNFPEIAISSARVIEGNSGTTSLNFSVTLNATSDRNTSSDRTVTVHVSDARSGIAESGVDYDAIAEDSVLTFASDETAKTFRVTVNSDVIDEADETVVLRLFSPNNAVFANNAESLEATGTIVDDDVRGVTLSESAVTVDEADKSAGENVAVYSVVLDSEPTGAVTIDLLSDDIGVATVSPASLRFTASDWREPKPVTVTAVNDDIDNPGDARATTVRHRLSAEGTDYAEVVAPNLSVTVNDDDGPQPGIVLSVSPAAVSENVGGATIISVTASILGESENAEDRTITVTVGSADDSASSGDDYATVSDFTIVILAGQNSAGGSFVLTPIDDRFDEGDETITVQGSSDGLSITGARVAITDNDDPGVELSADTLTVMEGRDGVYSISLRSGPNEGDEVSVRPRSANTHISFTPDRLTFDSENWASPQPVTFAVGEANEEESLTIEHAVDGYGDARDSEAAEGGTLTVSFVRSAEPEAEKEQTVQQTVAGIAAATVSNVTSNIGARFSAPSAPNAGISVSVAGAPSSFGSAGSKHGGLTPPANAVGEDGWQWRHRAISADELLRSGSFAITLGAAEGTDGVSPGFGGRVTIWGRGDLQFFESGGDGASGYDGSLLAGYLGADIALDGGWLAGVAVSRIASEADYTLGATAGGSGTLEADLTNVHPYVRAALGERSEVWAVLGFGVGEVTDSTPNGPESTSDLTMRMLSTGGRHLLDSDIGINLALLGDGSLATVETEDGVQSIDGISADVWRARLGVEASHTSVSASGTSLTAFLEVAGRQDGGDGTRGLGLELSPGLSFSDPDSRFALEARGRALALHSADNHREYGASLTASVMPGTGGRGLSMALTPRWGTPNNALNGSDRTFFLGDAGSGHLEDTLSLNSRIAYGFGAGAGIVSPFAELSLYEGDGRRMRIGSRYSLESSLDLELSGDRNERAFSGAVDNSVQLSGRIRF